MPQSAPREFISITIAVLTISDTRNEQTDKSGNYLAEAVKNANHKLAGKVIVKDDIYSIRAQVSKWIADSNIQTIITTGGTGFSPRDVTPEAIRPLLDKEIPGFGEYFRTISMQQVGTSTIQSRALAGTANNTYIFSLPGSGNACKTGWEDILLQQLDYRHRPCNFIELLPNIAS